MKIQSLLAIIILALALLSGVVMWQFNSEKTEDVSGTNSAMSEKNDNSAVNPADLGEGNEEETTTIEIDPKVRYAHVEKEGEPLWGVRIGNLREGKYDYYFDLDGQVTADPLNPGRGVSPYNRSFGPDGILPKVSSFNYPVSGASPLEGPGRNTVEFLYSGKIERVLNFRADFRGGYWGTDEFQPLNEAARANLEKIQKNEDLVSVSGVVKNEEGKPLSGASVLAMASAMAPRSRYCIRCVKTDKDGRFEIDRLDSGQAVIMARAPGFQVSEPRQFFLQMGPTSAEMNFVLKPGAMVSGTIRGINQSPIQGALIVFQSQSDRGGVAPQTVMSDSAGNYAITNLGKGNSQIRVQAEGFADTARTLFAVKLEDTGRREDFTLERGVVLRGKVLWDDNAKQGVPNAWVIATGQLRGGMDNYSMGFYTRTNVKADAEGNFVFDNLSPGAQLNIMGAKGIIVSSRGAQVRMPSNGTSPDSVEVLLPPVGSLRGVVLDSERMPIAGARVVVAGAWTQGNYRPYSSTDGYGIEEGSIPEATSDEQGRFELEGIPRDSEIVVKASAEGFAPGRSGRVSMERNEEAEIVLGLGGTLKGRVVVGEDEKAVERMSVWVVEVRESSNDTEMGEPIKTDSSGAFVATSLTQGKYMVYGEGSLTEGDTRKRLFLDEVKQIKIVEGEQVEQTFKAKYCGEIRGRVTLKETGEPVESVTISAQNTRRNEMIYGRGMQMLAMRFYSSAMSDSKGEFRLEALMPGRYMMSAYKTNLLSDPSNQNKVVELKEREEVKGVEMTISRGGVVTGVVLDDEENTMASISLSMTGNSGYPIRQQTSDEKGRFEFTGLSFQGGPFKIVSNPTSANSPLVGKSEEFSLTEKEPTADVVVRMSEGGSITGVVSDEAGEPVAGVQVRYQKEQDNRYGGMNSMRSFDGMYGGSGTPEVETDSSGAYAIKGMEAGSFLLTFTKAGYVSVTKQNVLVKDAEATTDVNVVVKPGTKVSGLLTDAEGQGLSGWSVSLVSVTGENLSSQMSQTTRSNGAFEMADLEQGKKYTASFSKNEYRDSNRRLNIQFRSSPFEAVEETQTFVVDASRTLRGRVVWADTSDGVGEVSIDFERYYSSNVVAPPEGQCALESFSMTGFNKSRADGTFEVSGIPAAIHQLILRGSGVKEEPSNIEVLKDLPVTDLGDVEVERGIVITGRLVDSKTGEAYQPDRRYGSPSVSLQAARRSSSSQLEIKEDGRFEISSVPEDLLVLRIDVQNFLPKEIRDFDLKPGEPTDLGDVVLERGLTVIGEFIDDASGEPYYMDRSYVQAQATVEDKTEQTSLNMSSEGGNRFRATRVPLNLKTITFISEKHLPTEVESFPEPNEEGEIDLGEVRLMAGITVKGTIVDADDKPISGANIALNSSGGQPYISRNESSDSEGKFTISGLTANVYRVSASKQGFVTVEKKDYTLKSGEEPKDLQIILGKARQVKCKLVDLNEKALEGWTVRLSKEGVSSIDYRNIKTDSEGFFLLDNIGNGNYTLELQKYGNSLYGNSNIDFRSGIFQVPESDDEGLVFVAEMGLGVRGRIVYAGTTDPAGNATISISRNGYSDPTPEGTRCQMRSFNQSIQLAENSDGSFEVPSLPVGMFTISVAGKTFVQKAIPAFELKGDEEKDMGDIEVERSHTIIGRFVNKATGDPIKATNNNYVNASGQTLAGERANMQGLFIGRDGEFKITGVPMGLVNLSLRVEGYNALEIKKIELDSGEETNLGDVELDAGYFLVMELVDGSTGKPYVMERSYPSINVQMENRTGSSSSSTSASPSNSKGEYQVKNLQWLPAKVTCSPEGFKPVTVEDIPEPQADGRIDLGTITLEAGIQVEGIVTDSDGEPIIGVRVSASRQNTSPSFYRSASTDAEGNFDLKGLVDGAYTLSVSKEGYASKSIKDIKINESGSQDVITIVLEKGMVLQGILVDLNAKGLSSWDISATSGGVYKGAQTKSDGSFEIKDLGSTAAYKFQINHYQNLSGGNSSMSFQTGEIAISPDEPTVIVVPVGVSFLGKLVYSGSSTGVEGAAISVSSYSFGRVEPQGDACVLSHASISLQKGTDTEGKFTLGPLAPGMYSISFSGKDFVRTSLQKMELTAEGDGNLGNVEVERSRVMTGRFIDSITREGYVVNSNGISVSGKTGAGFTNMEVTKIDRDGSFEVSGVPEILTEFRIQTPDHISQTITDAALLKSGDLGDVVLDRGITLRFQLLDASTGEVYKSESNRPIDVKTVGPDGKSVRSFSASPEGDEYVVKRVQGPVGSLTILPPDRAPLALDSVPEPSKEGVVDLGKLTLQGGESIQVSLKGPDGEPACKASITIKSKDGRYVRGTTDDKGVATIRGLVAGEKELSASAYSANGNPWIKGENKNVWIRAFKFEVPTGEELAIDLFFPAE